MKPPDPRPPAPGPQHAPQHASRRSFFKVLTTASTGVLTGACGKKLDPLIPLLVADREIVPGEEQWRPGICRECDAGCGVIARVMEGERVVERDGQKLRERIACIKKVEGNPLDPVSGGRLCARGQAAVQGLYHPDRLRGPQRRIGPRGEAQFAAVSWNEALAVAVEKLERVRKSDPTRLLFVTGPAASPRAASILRFCQAIGAPPPVTFEIADFPLERRAAEQVYGWRGQPVYDLARARYVLGIGADFLGGWQSPVFYSRQYGQFRQGRPGVRGHLVQAESRFSLTAANADQWLPLRPGTEPLFAAAIAHVLINEKLARQPFAVPPLILQSFQTLDLGAAARACGLTEERVRQIARDLAASEAPLVIPGASLVHTNSLEALTAAGFLNLLLAVSGKPGGVLPPAAPPIGERAAFSNFTAAFERAQFVFLDEANPFYTLPASAGLAQALEKWGPHEALVTFAPFLDDSAAYADLVLPDHHPLEATAAIAPDVSPAPGVTLATPFVQPLHDTRAMETVLVELAAKLGAKLDPATPRSLLERTLPADLTWEDAIRQGGTWGQLPTPLPARATITTMDLAAATFDGDPLDYTLHFQPYFSVEFHDGRSAHLPWMQELPDPFSSAMWGLPLEIDSRTAAKLGVKTGDLVRVESRHGRLEAPVYVNPSAMPGVVSMAIGQGHRHYGRYASGRGANPLAILAPVWEKTTGALAVGATRVRLIRVGERGGLIQFAPQDREAGPWGYR